MDPGGWHATGNRLVWLLVWMKFLLPAQLNVWSKISRILFQIVGLALRK